MGSSKISKILQEASDTSGVISKLNEYNLSTKHLCQALISVRRNEGERIRKHLRNTLRDILSEDAKISSDQKNDWINVLQERSVKLNELRLEIEEK